MKRPLPLALVLLAAPAWADELPVLSQSAVATPARTEADHDLGLELLWLPVESRTSVTDFVGRNHPGAQLDKNGQLILSGGHPADVAFELDGYRFTHLTPPLALLDGFAVANAGYGATWNDAVGVVSAGTRSGGARPQAAVELYDDFHDYGTKAASLALSGPLVRNRLFVVAAVRDDLLEGPGAIDISGITPTAPGPHGHALSAGLKLIWQLAPHHRLESLTLFQDGRIDDVARLGLAPDSEPTHGTRDLATGVRWLGRFGEVITASSQFGLQLHRDEEMPLRCRANSADCEVVSPVVETAPPTGSGASNILRYNWLRHDIARETGWQMLNAATVRIVERPTVRQRLRVTSRVDARITGTDYHVPGDALVEKTNGVNSALTTSYADDPRFEPGRLGWWTTTGSTLRTTHALESETRLFGRLWIVPGIGLATSRAHADDLTFAAGALTPHLAMAWDARGDRRTWIHASSHQRVSTNLDRVMQLGLGAPAQRRCQWNTDTQQFDKNCSFSGGRSHNTIGLPCGVNGIRNDGTTCENGIRLPRWWEHTLGASHELGNGVRFSGDLIYRRSIVQAMVTETNRLWNNASTDVIGFRNGRAETINDYSARSDDGDRYLGVTAAIAKQTGALHTLLSYTWSHHSSDVFGESAWGDIPGRLGEYSVSGPAADDHTHSIRARLLYDAHGVLSVGLLYSFDSGGPYLRLFRNDVTGAYENYRAPVGKNPGSNLNDPGDDRPTRYPDVSRLNLQLRLRARRLLHVDGDLYADAINILHSAGLEPTYFRLGLALRY